MSHEDSAPTDGEFFLDTESEHEPISVGDFPAPGAPASPARNSGGGFRAILGQLIPVVLGGVTVFGVYFLFLEDRLNKPPLPAKTEPSPKPDDQTVNNPPPPPALSDSPANSLPAPPVKTPAETRAERELAASRALGLAHRMSAQNASAAGKWFRKVVEDYPDTQAAQEAQDWLNKHPGGP